MSLNFCPINLKMQQIELRVSAVISEGKLAKAAILISLPEVENSIGMNRTQTNVSLRKTVDYT